MTTATMTAGQDDITPRQKDLLTSLIFERIHESEEREQWLSELNSGLSRYDASELISSFLMGDR